MNNIKIQNGKVQALIQVLDAMQLPIKPNRMRTRFVRLLAKHEMEVVTPDKKTILEEFCTKNDKGEPMFSDRKKGIYLFEDPDAEEEATKALQELLEEELAIPLDEYNKDMIITVANALLADEDIKVSGVLADWMDDWIDMFEDALDHYAKLENEEKKKKKKK